MFCQRAISHVMPHCSDCLRGKAQLFDKECEASSSKLFSCRRALSHVMSDCSGCFPPGRRHGKRLTMPPPLYALCPQTRCRRIHSCFSRFSSFKKMAHCHLNQMDSHHVVEVSLQPTTCLFPEGGSALSEPSSTTACLVPAPLTHYTQ